MTCRPWRPLNVEAAVWNLMWGRSPPFVVARGEPAQDAGFTYQTKASSFQSQGVKNVEDVRTWRQSANMDPISNNPSFHWVAFFGRGYLARVKPPWAHSALRGRELFWKLWPAPCTPGLLARPRWHSPSVTGSPGSAPGSWRSLPRCCCQGNRQTGCESGSAECERWPRSGPGWRRPPASPSPPLSFLAEKQVRMASVSHDGLEKLTRAATSNQLISKSCN